MARKKAVCLDIDDTTFDFAGVLVRLYNAKKGTCLTAHDLASWDFKDVSLTDARGNKADGKELREFFIDYEKHGLYAVLPLFDQAREALHILDVIDYNVFFITARDEKFRPDTEVSLIMENVKYAKLIHTTDKCKEINKIKKEYAVKAFADDKPETVQDVADKCDLEFNFLVDKPYNQSFPIKEEGNIIRIKSLLEMLRYLK